MFVQIDENKRLVCAVDDPDYAGEGWQEVPVPVDTVGGLLSDWKLEQGKLVFDPQPPQIEASEPDGLQGLLPVLVQNGAGRLDDQQLLQVAGSLPVWQAGQAYRQEDAVRYATGVYRAVEDHVSEPATCPTVAGNDKWIRVGHPHADGLWDWLAPVSQETAYPLGARVYYQGAIYQSLTETNMWEPSHYGWEKVESE